MGNCLYMGKTDAYLHDLAPRGRGFLDAGVSCVLAVIVFTEIQSLTVAKPRCLVGAQCRMRPQGQTHGR